MPEPKAPNPGQRLTEMFALPTAQPVNSGRTVDRLASQASIEAAKHNSEVDRLLNETFGIIDDVHDQLHNPHP